MGRRGNQCPHGIAGPGLESAKEEKQAHGEIETHHPGFLLGQGTEYCGKPENHPYQLFLHLNEIDHSRTKARHPQTNGCTEKLNQTIQEEFYAVAFRKKLYTSLEEIQADLDDFMKRYNSERTNQGRHCQGRTPMETFVEGIELYKKFVHKEELMH